jgi:hypothetical protein
LSISKSPGLSGVGWFFTTGETLEGDIWWPEPSVGGPVFARGVRSASDADIAKLESLLSSALAQAEKRVRIVTPYFPARPVLAIRDPAKARHSGKAT